MLGEPDGAAVLILLLLAGLAFRDIDRGNDAGLVILRLNDSPKADADQQIVGRERRGRVSQLAWCGEGGFDSRRRVNSTVIPLRFEP